MTKQLAYLCLQATRQGQASYAHVHEIIAGLERRGWAVGLYQPSYASSVDPVGHLKRLGAFLTVQLRLMRELEAYDALYIRTHPFAFPTAMWARYKGKIAVQELNGPYEDLLLAYPWARRFSTVFSFLTRQQLRLADAVVVVTDHLKSWLVGEIGRSAGIHVIPNAANVELFHPGAKQRLDGQQPYALFFGSLSAWQGIDCLLAAVKNPAWPSGLKLVIAGDGAERSKIEAAARCGRVTYLGSVPYRDMPGLVAGSLVALIPKSGVGNRAATGLFPLKVFETLACGVPAIVSDFPGQADLIRKLGAGLVVPSEDAPALARAVATLYLNPEMQRIMGLRGRLAVEADHSWDCRAKDTDKVLRTLVSQGKYDG